VAAVTDTSTSDAGWRRVIERLRTATGGEFVIQHQLGRGGMAAVFLAHDIALDRSVAIKVMSPGLLLAEGMVERFREEATSEHRFDPRCSKHRGPAFLRHEIR
jgi:serine/threonine-protein kinase